MPTDNVIDVGFGGRKFPSHRSRVMLPREPVPMLWIIPPDLIDGASSKALVSSLRRLDNIQVWQFEGGAVAFLLPDVLVKRGIPLDYDGAFLKRTRPLFQVVDSYTISDRSVLDLEIPDNKYWVRMSLKPEETNRQSCVYFKSFLSKSSPFAFKACSSYDLGETDLESMKEYLATWLAAAATRPIFGESLRVGTTKLARTMKPATERSYPKNGFEVRCSEYSPCTWPWIELYLRMRRELPVKQRLSIDFFNCSELKRRPTRGVSGSVP